MEAFFIYFLKSSGVILLFLACYKFFLSRETFYKSNRYFLLSGLAIALVLPLISYTKTAWVTISSSNIPLEETIGQEATEVVPQIELASILFTVYIIGILFATIRLSVQFLSLRKVLRNSRIAKEGKFKILESNKPLQPLSFFNSIIYHPKNHTEEDIKAILTHEKIHARQHHSIDILAMHLFSIFQWCNPFIYLYKFYLKENLEFIADTDTISTEIHKKNYQYLLLKSSLGEKHFNFVNPFFNSSVKKRIVMLNKKKSKKVNSIKYGIMLPLLIGFILLFNVETIAKLRTASPSISSTQQDAQLNGPKVYSISKEATDNEIEALKKQVEKDKGKLTIEKIVRNLKGHIIALSVIYEMNDSRASASFDAKDNGAAIIFGISEDGGVFIENKISKVKPENVFIKNKEKKNIDDYSEPNKFNEVVYDKEKSGDFPHLALSNHKNDKDKSSDFLSHSVLNYKPPAPLYYMNGRGAQKLFQQSAPKTLRV